MAELHNTSQKFVVLFANLSEDMGWYGHSTVQAINVKRKEESWLLTVKVERKGKLWVCFSEAPTIDDAIDLFYKFMVTKNATGVKWYPSKY